jgi:replicative DNA helicase
MDRDYLLDRVDFESYYRRHLGTLKKSGGEYYGLCFMHSDKKPSLRVNLDKGLWTCPVCDKGGDIFKLHMEKYHTTFTDTLKEIASEQGITMTKPKLVKTYDYHDADGNKLYEKQRWEPSSNGGKKDFKFLSPAGHKRGCEPVLYNLPAILKSKWVILVEGEGCADKLIGWGLPATTLDSGADSKWHEEYTEQLKGKKVVILPDNDEPGKAYAERVADHLDTVKIIHLPVPRKGDIIDWQGTKEELTELIKQSPLWEPVRPYVSVRTLTDSVIHNMFHADIDSLGERTGIVAIDNRIGCFRKKTLTVIAGRPSMGKTAFMFSVMLNMARREVPIILFTPETTKEESTERLLCQINDVNMQQILLRQNVEVNERLIRDAKTKLDEMGIWIDDTGGIQLEWLDDRLSQAIKEKGVRCVFIDYLQLMNTTTKDSKDGSAYIGYISRNLKRIAKENNIPVVLLAQVNRKCEERTNKRPMNSDLKGSGDIEQDADGVMFLYRDEQYHPDTSDKGMAEVIISKYRNGKTGTVKLAFLAESMRFADLCEGVL